MVELSEKLLMDAGGWQTMKHAKALLESGRVVSAHYEPPVLRGLVREGELEFRAGLKISSKTNIENICGCRQSREWGTICAHSLAVGLHRLKPKPASIAPSPVAVAPPVQGPILGEEETGELVELFVILPPTLQQSWQKGQIVVATEVQHRGRRVMLNALEPTGRYRCSRADAAAVTTLRSFNDGKLPAMLILPTSSFLELLDALRGHPRVSFGKKTPATVDPAPLRPRLSVKHLQDGTLRISTEMPVGTLLPAGGRVWLQRKETLTSVARGLPEAYHTVLTEPVTVPASAAGAFLKNELPALKGFFELDGGAANLVPEVPRFSLQLEGSLNHLAGRLQAIYRRSIVTVGLTPESETFAVPDPSDPGQLLTRNLPAEHAARKRLAGFTGPSSDGEFVLKGENNILNFFGRQLPQLQRDWEVKLGTRFQNVTRKVERIAPELRFNSSGENWLELDVKLGTSGGHRFSSADIQRLLQSGKNYVRLSNDRTAVFDADLLDELQSVLLDCQPQQDSPGRYRLEKAQASYLVSAFSDEDRVAMQGVPEWTRRASGAETLQPVPLGGMESVLRPYQKTGVYWMHFLAQNGFGGILADEMGLGKTLQALTFLVTKGGRSLVVCPSSLVFNWREEAARFAPELRVLAIQGANRAGEFDKIATSDLVITSYPLLRRDLEKYKRLQFNTIILDEAQHIKNPDTQNARAAGSLQAENRFVLTGTPVENSVRDLWSLMHFLMPGYLGHRTDFRDRYEVPISSAAGSPEAKRLNARLRPFLLRRLKKDVVTDLPEKLVQVIQCSMSGDQQELYTSLLEAGRKQIHTDPTFSKNAGKARMLMLTTLLRLRQVSCHPQVVLKDQAAMSSGKMESFTELLQQILDGGHRVLVFSQFVSMLGILRAHLEQNEIPHCYLDGSTTHRQEVVERFQKGDVPVFLISLKAGGVGLNLTAADTVIHFDPWWNPAVEAQATDRAHRIGQKNPVTVYKLITTGSVEEKILNLQAKKRELIDQTVESEEPFMNALSLSEIEALLE